MKHPSIALLLSAALVLTAGPASAAVFTATTAAELETILHSTALANGDLVKVAAGTFTLSSWTTPSIDVEITIRGEGQGVTVINGPGIGSSFLLVRDASHYLADLTLEDFGEAIRVEPAVPLKLSLLRVEIAGSLNSTAGIAAAEASGSGRLTRVEVNNCRFTGFAGIPIDLGIQKIDSASLIDNFVSDGTTFGIWVGGDTNTSNLDDYAKRVIVRGNHVQNIGSGTLGLLTMAKGIYVTGHDVLIEGNVIADILPDHCTDCGDQVNGIYTKATHSVISGNVLRNVGPGYALLLKGNERSFSGPTSNPPGYNAIVANNQILVFPTSGWRSNGIKTQVDDVTITGNHLEGVNEIGILVQSQAIDDVTILGNAVFLQGAAASGPGPKQWGIAVFSQPYLFTYGTGRAMLIAHNRTVNATRSLLHREKTSSTADWNDDAAFPSSWVVTPNLAH